MSETQKSNDEKLKEFALWAIDDYTENFSDLDGFEIQEKMLELGLLETKQPSEPCGGGCSCAEEFTLEQFAEAEVQCHHLVPWLGKLVIARCLAL